MQVSAGRAFLQGASGGIAAAASKICGIREEDGTTTSCEPAFGEANQAPAKVAFSSSPIFVWGLKCSASIVVEVVVDMSSGRMWMSAAAAVEIMAEVDVAGGSKAYGAKAT